MESLRLFEADVGMVAPMSGRCGVTVRLFETDVGSMCAYFREMWDSLCLFDRYGTCCAYLRQMCENLRIFEADVGQVAPI